MSQLGKHAGLLAVLIVSSASATTFAQEKPVAELVETLKEVRKLTPAAAYKPAGNIVEIELSEYAGYSGLIVANGGLEPSEDSTFFKKFGFKLKLTLSEEESWSALNSGKMAGSATTVDVLAAYGNQFEVVAPALIGFSRGADGIVVRKEFKSINDLRGKILSTAQFTEADFFIRYLAQVAGLEVNMLATLDERPDPQKLNLVFCADGFASGDLFLRELAEGKNRLAGCVTWAPKTTEVVEKSLGKARLLTTSLNLLIVADVLILNKGFAQANPEKVNGIVEGLITGNSMIREQPDKYLDLIGKVFKWDAEEVRTQLAKVHLANYAENQAFFNGKIDSAGSYGYIYERAAQAYGPKLIGAVPDSEKFLDASPLKVLGSISRFATQTASIKPIPSDRRNAEPIDITTRNVVFQFKPNVAQLEMTSEFNRKELAEVASYLRVSPGSKILLRGHADGSGRKEQEAFDPASIPDWMITLKGLSKDRCSEIRRYLVDQHKVDPSRIQTEGVGIAEPTGKGPKADRRVEVKWIIID